MVSIASVDFNGLCVFYGAFLGFIFASLLLALMCTNYWTYKELFLGYKLSLAQKGVTNENENDK